MNDAEVWKSEQPYENSRGHTWTRPCWVLVYMGREVVMTTDERESEVYREIVHQINRP